MALRCLLFSSDARTADPICQVLADLDVEAEYCAEAPAAVEMLTGQSFQIVIIDWDNQPEAGFLLSTARERKAADRPLTLAIVSNDASLPKALQAGANSVLRKPIVAAQVKDTLTTARALLKAKQDSATGAQTTAAAAGAGSTALPASIGGNETTLRAGEFLSAGTGPATGFDTESEMQKSVEQSAVNAVEQLRELEPMASAVAETHPAYAAPDPDEPRGLQWYLKTRAGAGGPGVGAGAASSPEMTQAMEPPTPAKPDLLGFDDPGHSESLPTNESSTTETEAAPNEPSSHEQREEAKLFAYISGEGEKETKKERSGPGLQLRKGPIVAAAVLAACAIAAAPQAPWHSSLRGLWGNAQRGTHAWLNPQPVTTPTAPAAHEDFGRPGDEYKMPVAENIPDATTDPSQIRVVPVVDPTAKKPNNAGANADQAAGQASVSDATDQAANAQAPADGSAGQANSPQTAPATTQMAGAPAAAGSDAPIPSGTIPGTPVSSTPVTVPVQPRADTTSASTTPQPAVQPTVLKSPPPRVTVAATTSPGSASSSPGPPIPSSLKSQMASMVPDASGNKPPEAAMQSIEPVNIPEAAERALLTDQPAMAYPANAKGMQGTVVLDVLVGRDGTIEDAKFLQGSLAFARTAIDGVKQWKFKPYIMNGRPVSVETHLTISFNPGQ
jgi:protein TonB